MPVKHGFTDPTAEGPGGGVTIVGPNEWNSIHQGDTVMVTVTLNGGNPAASGYDGGDYGPNTPGTTSAGINEARASLPVTGGTVYVKNCASPYVITSGITDNAAADVHFVSDGATIACGAGSGFPVILLQGIRSSASGFVINGTNTLGSGIALNGAEEIVENNEVYGAGNYCIDVWPSGTKCIIAKNYCHNGAHDDIVTETGAIDILVIGNVCDTNGEYNGIAVVSGTRVNVSNNIIRNILDAGIAFENLGVGYVPCVDCIAQGNLIYNCGLGVSVYSHQSTGNSLNHGVISNNVIIGCVDGIALNSGTDIVVEGNLLDSPGSNIPIYLGSSYVTNCIISGNMIVGGGNGGVNINAAASFVTIKNNIFDTVTYPIYFSAPLTTYDHFIVEGNQCFSSVNNDFYNGGTLTNSLVTNNFFGRNVTMGTTTNCVFRGNPGYNPPAPTQPSLPGTGVAFPLLPYDANYVVSNSTGLTGLTLDGYSVSYATGTAIFVAANHSLVPTYNGSPTFNVLPI
jgi:hypothetical protein